MPYPTPNGPTLNDLEYQAYNQAGSLNTTAFVISYFITVSDVLNTKENIVAGLPGISYLVDTSDFINTAENVVVAEDSFGPNIFSITVSDTTVTSENVDALKAGARNVAVSDTTVTSENVSLTPPA